MSRGGIEEGGGIGPAKAAKLRIDVEENGKEGKKAPPRIERLLSSLLDNCGAEVFAIDREGKVPFMNATAGAADFNPGCSLWDLFQPSIAEIRAAAADDIFASGNGGLLQIEAELDGRLVIFEDRLTPFKDENGSLEFVLVSCRDVGALRNGLDATSSRAGGISVKSCGWLESPKRTSKERGKIARVSKIRDYAAEIREHEAERDALGDGVDEMLVEKIGTGMQLLWGNKELCNVSGQSIEELKGRRCHEAVRGNPQPCEGCTAMKAIETASIQEGEIKSSDGRCYKSKSTPIKDLNGKVNGVLHVAMDITEWKELDERLKQSKAKADELSRLKSEFLSCISHEIRTPLNAIVGMAELMKDIIQPGNKEVEECCQEIESASDMLLSILNDILDYALLESGSVKLFSQVFVLRDEIEAVFDLMARRASEKDIDYKFTYEEGLPSKVVGDPRHLRRILTNILDNALKFTSRGHVHLHVSKDALPQGVPEGTCNVRIELSDTGIGISKDALPKIFDPFTQEDSSNKRAYGGTGLGLAIVRKLVSVMGGHIELKSEKGLGSTFIVNLPFVENGREKEQGSEIEHTGEDKASHEEICSFHGVKALLLDTSVSSALVRRILGTLDVSVKHVKAQEDALLALSAEAYDVLFFDSSMAGEMGLQKFSRLLKGASPMKSPPLIAMVASQSGECTESLEKDICAGTGISAVIAKPPRRSQIIAILKAQCKKNTAAH